MSDPRHRHPYDCIAFLDQRWDAMTAEMRAKAVQVEAELHMRIAALTSELAEARRQLGEVTRERDALKAGKWAGAWKPGDGVFAKHARYAFKGRCCVFVLPVVAGRAWWKTDIHDPYSGAASEDAAKAAADAHLVAAGWWLEGGPHGAGEAK